MHDANHQPLNAFCVDYEEWFHICGVSTPYENPRTWADAPSFIEKNTDVLLKLLDEAKSRGTFLCVGWVAERHPHLIRRLVDAGHEIGCHSQYHRLIYSLTPEEFEEDTRACVGILREVSGQKVVAFRAPGFSMKRECFWAYPILRRNGIEIDVSIVPAARDHGGVSGFKRDPFLLHTEAGDVKCFPVSVMNVMGKTVPFSGGGYLRLFPMSVIKAGFRQNHREGRPGMAYIHPREIDPTQPRLKLPPKKYFKYYVNIAGCEDKLRELLKTFRFTTVSEVVANVRRWPEHRLVGGDIETCDAPAPVARAG